MSNTFKRKIKTVRLHVGRRFSIIAVIGVCFLCFTPPSGKTNIEHQKIVSIDPGDMIQNDFYYFSDHGSGLAVAQFDRMDGNNIHTFASIQPLLLSFTGAGLWGTVDDAGSIREATTAEIVHLLLCIVAGQYIP
jgi:hypothetical protein